MTSRLFSINSIQSILVLNSLLLILLVVDKTMAALPFNLTYQSVKRLHQLQEVKGRILTGLRLEQAPVLPNGLKRPALQKALSQLHDSAAVSGHGNYNYPESVAFILFSKPPGKCLSVYTRSEAQCYQRHTQNREPYTTRLYTETGVKLTLSYQ